MERSVLSKYQPGLVTSTKQPAYGTFSFLTMQVGKQNFVFDDFMSFSTCSNNLFAGIIYCRVHYAEMCQTLLHVYACLRFPRCEAKTT